MKTSLKLLLLYRFKICTYTSSYTFLGSINDSWWWSGQVLSTPISCWDGMNCTITDSNNVTGMASTYFHNIQGEINKDGCMEKRLMEAWIA